MAYLITKGNIYKNQPTKITITQTNIDLSTLDSLKIKITMSNGTALTKTATIVLGDNYSMYCTLAGGELTTAGDATIQGLGYINGDIINPIPTDEITVPILNY